MYYVLSDTLTVHVRPLLQIWLHLLLTSSQHGWYLTATCMHSEDEIQSIIHNYQFVTNCLRASLTELKYCLDT